MGSVRKHTSLALGVYVRYCNVYMNILCSLGYREIVSIFIKLPVCCGVTVEILVYVSFIPGNHGRLATADVLTFQTLEGQITITIIARARL